MGRNSEIKAREIPRIRPQRRCEPGSHLPGCGCTEAPERRARERERREGNPKRK